MQKIILSDKYASTKAVLDGKKTGIRIIIKNKDVDYNSLKPKYKVGEVVAIAQSYKSIGLSPNTILRKTASKDVNGERADKHQSWENKRFVCAEFMPHHIRIENVRIARLQDISDEEYIKDGLPDFVDSLLKESLSYFRNHIGKRHMIIDRINSSEEWIVMCGDCAVEKANDLLRNTPAATEDDIFTEEAEPENSTMPLFCDICGKPLQYIYTGDFSKEAEYMDLNKADDRYMLSQVCEDTGVETIFSAYPSLIKKAYAVLCDTIYGKGTWNDNPYVFDYDITLVD